MQTTELFRYTLTNGIRCILHRAASPVAYCSLTINAGSRDELRGEEGIAHFTEHSLFKGTSRRRAYHINNRLEKLGGELNAFTTKEETVIHATVLRADIWKAAELIADVVFDSSFPEREIEREREVVLEEIASYKDSPPERIYDEFEDMLFRGSPLGHNILGDRKSVTGFTGDSIRAFTRRCYNTDNMVFAVAADMTESGFVKLCDRYLGCYPASVREFERDVAPAHEPFAVSMNRSTHQAHCILGNRAYGLHHPNRVALSLLVNILGGPAANSRLNSLLREKHGLAYTVEASYSPYCDTGVAAIYFGTDKDKVDRCLELTGEVLRSMCEKPLTARALSAAKKQFIGQLAISLENREGYILGAGKSYLVYGEVDSRRRIYEKVAAVTADEILRAATDVFSSTSHLLYNGHKSRR